MYNQYFGLTEYPFSIAPDPQFMYRARRDREALAHFQYGLSVSGGFVQLTGEVGTGKTMLIRALLEQVPEDVDVALMLNPVVTVLEFMAGICDELQVSYPQGTQSLKVLVDALNAYLLDNHANGRRTVLIVDEAQNLKRDVLEQVRLLTNLETNKQKLLQIIFVGQQELNEKLAAKDLRQLAQRITARYELGPLSRRETGEYIAHRCRVAGAPRPLFSRSAINWVYYLARGNPRMTNIICDRALLGAYTDNLPFADGPTVRKAAMEIGQSVPGWKWLRHWKWVPVSTATSVLFVSLAIWQWSPGFAFKQGPGTPLVDLAKPAPAVSPVDKQVSDGLAVKTTAKPAPSLGGLLEDDITITTTEAAFHQLFSQWGLENVELAGRAGCEVADESGFACIFSTGTWNNLRSYNRPAVIELLDKQGRRHHILVSGLNKQYVSLNFGGSKYTFPIAEVDRYWYGKYLLFWRPPAISAGTLRRGTRGPDVVWLRNILDRYQGKAFSTSQSDVFDQELESQVKDFQRHHKLVADGVVGRFTLIQLNNYNQKSPPPLLSAVSQTKNS